MPNVCLVWVVEKELLLYTNLKFSIPLIDSSAIKMINGSEGDIFSKEIKTFETKKVFFSQPGSLLEDEKLSWTGGKNFRRSKSSFLTANGGAKAGWK